MNLTRREYDLLQSICLFGNFVVRQHVELWGRTSKRWASELLLNLEQKEYLKVVSSFGGYNSYVYAPTYKARKLFGLSEHVSHNVATMRKSLILSHFLFRVTDRERFSPVGKQYKREQYLSERGIEIIRNGKSIIRLVDPFLIQEPFARASGICVVLVDEDGTETGHKPIKFLRMAFERYAPITAKIPISFVVVTETQERALVYEATSSSPRWFKGVPPLMAFSIDFRYPFISLKEWAAENS